MVFQKVFQQNMLVLIVWPYFILLLQDPQNPGRNRGFAFVEYYNNACADFSRQKMAAGSFKLDGNTPTVTWADPKITPDHSAAASQV